MRGLNGLHDIHSACVHNTWTHPGARRAEGLHRGASLNRSLETFVATIATYNNPAETTGYTVVSQASAHSRVSTHVTVLLSRTLSTHSRVSAQACMRLSQSVSAHQLKIFMKKKQQNFDISIGKCSNVILHFFTAHSKSIVD